MTRGRAIAILGAPAFLGALGVWGGGHLVASWTVKQVATSMGMVSRVGHHGYYWR